MRTDCCVAPGPQMRDPLHLQAPVPSQLCPPEQPQASQPRACRISHTGKRRVVVWAHSMQLILIGQAASSSIAVAGVCCPPACSTAAFRYFPGAFKGASAWLSAACPHTTTHPATTSAMLSICAVVPAAESPCQGNHHAPRAEPANLHMCTQTDVSCEASAGVTCCSKHTHTRDADAYQLHLSITDECKRVP